MTSVQQTFVWLFDELGDPRVKDWFLMANPIQMVFILVLYLYIVKRYLPEWMKDKPAYSLKSIIKVYNISQIVLNSIIFYGLLTSGWTTNLHLRCLMPDYSNDPEPVKMVNWMWWAMFLKITELIETVFFVLRKKDSQASFLHIYHHIINFSVMWIAVKYVAGGMASLTPLINTFVHVVMYSYYYLSSVASPDLRVILNKYKKWLTVIQMIQFTILLIHSLQALAPSCPAPRVITWIYIPNLVLVYYLFIVFFIKSYGKKSEDKKSA